MSSPDLIASLPLFRDLPEAQLLRLRAAAAGRTVAKGELIFKQGDLPEALCIVENGAVEIVLDAAGGEIVLDRLGDGAFFGELALFEQRPRTASARAARETRLLLIPRAAIIELIAAHPPAAVQFLVVIAARLRGADALLAKLKVENVNALMEGQMTFGDRIADRVARFGGSWPFILLFFFFLLAWAAVNTTWLFTHLLNRQPTDPFPYIFLNVLLNALSAAQAPIIMMSQNRQTEKDRLAADQAFQVALRSELAIQQLHQRMDAQQGAPK